MDSNPFTQIETAIADMKQTFMDEIAELKTRLEQKPEPDEYMTKKQVAEFLKKDINTIDYWVRNKKLKMYSFEGSRFFLKSEIKSMIKPIN